MSEKKIPQEHVILEHRSGAPHFSVDGQGALRHYCTNTPPQGEVVGAVLRPGDSVTVQIPLPGVGAPSSPTRTSTGPAQVASDAYRSGWDAINWARKGEGKPS